MFLCSPKPTSIYLMLPPKSSSLPACCSVEAIQLLNNCSAENPPQNTYIHKHAALPHQTLQLSSLPATSHSTTESESTAAPQPTMLLPRRSTMQLCNLHQTNFSTYTSNPSSQRGNQYTISPLQIEAYCSHRLPEKPPARCRRPNVAK